MNEDNKEQQEQIREVIIEKKSGFSYPEMIIIMIIAILFGFLIGNIVSFTKSGTKTVPSELEEFLDTYNGIVDNYYDDVDKEKLLDAGIKGMISYLDDPYATYFEGDNSVSFNQSLTGSYEGVGIEVTKLETGVTVTKVFEGSPAAKVGLKEGDVLLKVGGEDIAGQELSDITAKIKDLATKGVEVIVVREGIENKFILTKATIDIPQVTSKVYEKDGKKIGYLRIELFSNNITKQFKKQMGILEKEKVDRIVIDVRDNPGGYLTQVTEILSLFMNKKQVLYQLDTKGDKQKIYGTSKKATYNYPVAVIINEESASAAEILAAAFKETYGASIVGVHSYGKGTVQKTDDLNNGDTIKYTVQKWLTPKGNWLNKKGLTPTDEVTLSLGEQETLTEENDLQLQKALDLISKK